MEYWKKFIAKFKLELHFTVNVGILSGQLDLDITCHGENKT